MDNTLIFTIPQYIFIFIATLGLTYMLRKVDSEAPRLFWRTYEGFLGILSNLVNRANASHNECPSYAAKIAKNASILVFYYFYKISICTLCLANFIGLGTSFYVLFINKMHLYPHFIISIFLTNIIFAIVIRWVLDEKELLGDMLGEVVVGEVATAATVEEVTPASAEETKVEAEAATTAKKPRKYTKKVKEEVVAVAPTTEIKPKRKYTIKPKQAIEIPTVTKEEFEKKGNPVREHPAKEHPAKEHPVRGHHYKQGKTPKAMVEERIAKMRDINEDDPNYDISGSESKPPKISVVSKFFE